MFIALPVSAGELIDKLTILDIKTRRIKDTIKLKQIEFERKPVTVQYKRLLRTYPSKKKNIEKLRAKLHDINSALWRTEELIRDSEQQKKFGPAFIKLARDVYRLNDRRYEIKQKINRILDSFVHEVKDYTTSR